MKALASTLHIVVWTAIVTIASVSAFVVVVPCSTTTTTTIPTLYPSFTQLAAASATGNEKLFKVFIDGEAGTTGLQVRQRLEARDDLEVISPPADLRKDEATRKKFINEADAVILCTSFCCVEKKRLCGLLDSTFDVMEFSLATNCLCCACNNVYGQVFPMLLLSRLLVL
jgi:hypothetical protein